MRPGPVGGSLGDLRDPLYLNSIFLLANSVVPPALASLFWFFVARFYAPDMVGEAVALVLPSTLLATAASLGLHVGLIRFLPSAGPRAFAMVRSSLTLTGLVALALALIFLGGIPYWGRSIDYVVADPRFVLGFLLLTEASALSLILDSIFIALRRASYALVRNALFGLVRIPLPLTFYLLAWVGGITIFASYALGALAAFLVALGILLPRMLPGFRMRFAVDLGPVRGAMAFSLGNHITTMAQLLPASLIPLMILNAISPTKTALDMAAYFYMAWQGALLVFIIPSATTSSLLAEGSHGIVDYRFGGRRTLVFTLLLLGPAVLITFGLSDIILGFFGPGYAQYGSPLLRLFAISAFPMTLNAIYMTSLRLENRIPSIVAVGVAPVVFTLGIGYFLLPTQGLAAIGWGWLLGHALVAGAVAALDPRRWPLRLLWKTPESLAIDLPVSLDGERE